MRQINVMLRHPIFTGFCRLRVVNGTLEIGVSYKNSSQLVEVCCNCKKKRCCNIRKLNIRRVMSQHLKRISRQRI